MKKFKELQDELQELTVNVRDRKPPLTERHKNETIEKIVQKRFNK